MQTGVWQHRYQETELFYYGTCWCGYDYSHPPGPQVADRGMALR